MTVTNTTSNHHWSLWLVVAIIVIVAYPKSSVRALSFRIITRRHSLQKVSLETSSIVFGGTWMSPQCTHAATPITTEEADSFTAKWQRFLRKPPSKSILRPTLNRDFAVLLMRCSYNAMDQLDCVPMDQFQRDFFLIRQAEYEPYLQTLGPGLVQQGDLTNPYYFDFISFAQYAAIDRDVSIQPAQFFEEQVAVEEDAKEDKNESQQQHFVTRVIQRRPEWSDNALLPSIHDQLVGEAILDYLIQVFGNTTSAIPFVESYSSSSSPIRLSTSQILAMLQQVANLFVISGFAWDRTVKQVSSSSSSSSNTSTTTFEIHLMDPVTLWSGQALQQKNASPTNDFFRKTLVVLFSRLGERGGISVLKSKVEYKDNVEEVTTLVLSQLK